MHAAWAFWSVYLPTSQAMHGCGFGLVVTATLYWPTAQSVQSAAASWPALAVVLPAAQFVHDVEAAVAWWRPISHEMHAVWAVVDVYLPMTQSMQTVAAVC
jgi:hypothetical protein